jgi:hypothetical protein
MEVGSGKRQPRPQQRALHMKLRRGDLSRLIGADEQAATFCFCGPDYDIIEKESVRCDVQEGRRVHLLEFGLGRLCISKLNVKRKLPFEL